MSTEFETVAVCIWLFILVIANFFLVLPFSSFKGFIISIVRFAISMTVIPVIWGSINHLLKLGG